MITIKIFNLKMLCLFCETRGDDYVCKEHSDIFSTLTYFIINIGDFDNIKDDYHKMMLWFDDIDENYKKEPYIINHFLNWTVENWENLKDKKLENIKDCHTILLSEIFLNYDGDFKYHIEYKIKFNKYDKLLRDIEKDFMEKNDNYKDEYNSKLRKNLISYKNYYSTINKNKIIDDYNYYFNAYLKDLTIFKKYNFIPYMYDFLKNEVEESKILKNQERKKLKEDYDDDKEEVHRLFKIEKNDDYDFIKSENDFDEVRKKYFYYLENFKNIFD